MIVQSNQIMGIQFIPEGSATPENLLHQCKNRNMVFFCSADSSHTADLTTFKDPSRKTAIKLQIFQSPISSIIKQSRLLQADFQGDTNKTITLILSFEPAFRQSQRATVC